MKKLTPAALIWLKNLAEGIQTSSHSSQREACLERGLAVRVDGRYAITEAGRDAIAVIPS